MPARSPAGLSTRSPNGSVYVVVSAVERKGKTKRWGDSRKVRRDKSFLSELAVSEEMQVFRVYFSIENLFSFPTELPFRQTAPCYSEIVRETSFFFSNKKLQRHHIMRYILLHPIRLLLRRL